MATHKNEMTARRWNTGALSNMTYAVIVGVGTLAACQDPVLPNRAIRPAEELFWSVHIDHPAVNLSTSSPSNTLQLTATAHNNQGEPLLDAPSAHFRSLSPSNAALTVLEDGTLIGRSQTAAAGIKVVAEMEYQGITRIDTATVVVTETPTIPEIETYSIQLPMTDSNRLAASFILDPRSKSLPRAVTAKGGGTIPRVVYFFESSNPWIASVNRQTGVLTANKPGRVVIRSSVMVYGVPARDSIEFIVTNPLMAMVAINNSPLRIDYTVGVGGDVLWLNWSSDSVDIVFDDPGAAELGGSTPIGMSFRDTNGNIALFPSIDSFSLDDARVRRFSAPGTYPFHSTRRTNVSGRIIVR